MHVPRSAFCAREMQAPNPEHECLARDQQAAGQRVSRRRARDRRPYYNRSKQSTSRSIPMSAHGDERRARPAPEVHITDIVLPGWTRNENQYNVAGEQPRLFIAARRPIVINAIVRTLLRRQVTG